VSYEGIVVYSAALPEVQGGAPQGPPLYYLRESQAQAAAGL